MTIYLDREFDAHNLADLLTQIQAATTEEWYRELEDRVWYTYRDLARADVKAGRSKPEDHPDLSPGWFVEAPFDLNNSSAVELWGTELERQLDTKSFLFSSALSDKQGDQPVSSNDYKVTNTRRALEILPGAAELLGVEPGRMEWTGAADAEPIDTPDEPELGLTFGDRLRDWLNKLRPAEPNWRSLHAIPDAIDSDRDELGDELGSVLVTVETEQRRLRLARERVEASVEELRYTISGTFDTSDEHGYFSAPAVRDVVDVEMLQERLTGIFADLARATPTYYKADPAAARFEIPGRDGALGLRVAVNPDGTTFFWPLDKLVGQGFALSGAAARDLVRLLGAALPAEPEFALAAPMDTPLLDTVTKADIDYVEGEER